MQQSPKYFWILLKKLKVSIQLVSQNIIANNISAFINYAKFSISSQGPQLWNRILSHTEKTSQTFSFLRLESKYNFYLLTMSWIISRS